MIVLEYVGHYLHLLEIMDLISGLLLTMKNEDFIFDEEFIYVNEKRWFMFHRKSCVDS